MSGNVNGVFYAETYHPIQAGSIDGTDVLPHDNAVYRALLCSAAGLYDPFGDPKATGDPYCTVFVGRLSRLTDEGTLRKAMIKYGRVKDLRLVRDIVTGASCGYAFVEYETEREMRHAYEGAHHSFIDDCEVIVDYYRQHLMPGWIPRRLGGGLGGKKESGQLRFGGRERPFRAPLRPIPHEDLKRLGISPPPEGRYLSRYQIPSPPRRRSGHTEREESPARLRKSKDRESSHRRHRSPVDRQDSPKEHHKDREESSHRRHRSPVDRQDSPKEHHKDREESSHRRHRSPVDRQDSPKEHHKDREESSHRRHRTPADRQDSPKEHHKRHRTEHSHRHGRRSNSRNYDT